MQTIIKKLKKKIKMSRNLAIKMHKLIKSIKRLLNNKIRLSSFKYIVFKIILVLSSILIIIEA